MEPVHFHLTVKRNMEMQERKDLGSSELLAMLETSQLDICESWSCHVQQTFTRLQE